MIKKDDINKLSELSRISLSKDEQEKLAYEIEAILGYVAQVEGIAEKEASVSLPPLFNTMRDDIDEHAPGVYSEILLAQASRREGKYIKVKKIIER